MTAEPETPFTTAVLTERQLLAKLFEGVATPAEMTQAIETLRDADFSDSVLRRLWQAARDSWESIGAVDLPYAAKELRSELKTAAPPAIWYADLLAEAVVGRPVLDLVTDIARAGAAAALDVARAQAVTAFADTAPPGAMDRALAVIAAAQERRSALVSGLITRPAVAKDLVDLLETGDDQPPEELVERLITRPGVVIAYGASGSGKSYALMAACLDIVGGGGCFCGAEGLQLRPRTTRFGDEPDRVLWVYGSEDPERRIRSRARELWANGPHHDQVMPRGQFLVASPGSHCLGTPEGLRWLRREIEASRATIVILDTVQSLTSASLDTSDGGQVARWMVTLHSIRDSFGVVIIPVCHTSKTPSDAKSARGKADSLLGSQAWRALADGMVMIDAPDGDASAGTLRLIKGKDVDSPIPPLRIGMDGDSKRFRPLEDEEGEGQQGAQAGRVDARIGRPKVFNLDAAVALRRGHPDGLPWSDNAAMMALFGGGRTQWFSQRADLQRALLALGHVVVDGRLRWDRPDTRKETPCPPERSTSLPSGSSSTTPEGTSPTTRSPSVSGSLGSASRTISQPPSGSPAASVSSDPRAGNTASSGFDGPSETSGQNPVCDPMNTSPESVRKVSGNDISGHPGTPVRKVQSGWGLRAPPGLGTVSGQAMESRAEVRQSEPDAGLSGLDDIDDEFLEEFGGAA
jgi:hypothetical protein